MNQKASEIHQKLQIKKYLSVVKDKVVTLESRLRESTKEADYFQ